jgi:hypothetical protein
MRIKRVAGDLATLVFIVAALYMLLRPGSPSVDFVDVFGKSITSVVAEAADFI